VAVLVVTDREGNLSFKHVGDKKVKNEQLKKELNNRISESNLLCVKPKKEFKKAVKDINSKKVIVNQNAIKERFIQCRDSGEQDRQF
jgi:hypothetical protein